jgi:hypothetical protein
MPDRGQSTQGANDQSTVAVGCKSVGGLLVELDGPSGVVVSTARGSSFANVILMTGAAGTPMYAKVAAAAARLQQDYGTWAQSNGGSPAALQLDTAAIAADCAALGDPTGNS